MSNSTRSTPIAISMFPLLCSALDAQTYSVQDPDFGQVINSVYASATNESGLLVRLGSPAWASLSQPIGFDDSGAFALSLLGGDREGNAHGVNESGTIVGVSIKVTQAHPTSLFSFRAVRWQNGQVIDLASLVTSGPNLELRAATAINDSGTIVGEARNPAQLDEIRAFKLEGGTLSDLGVLAVAPAHGSAARAWANAIDPYGTVVGGSIASDGSDHAVMWRNGQIIDLHTTAALPGHISEAFDINGLGAVVGAADFIGDAWGYRVAALWINGQARNLGTLAGLGSQPTFESVARSINDLGIIVGDSHTTTSAIHACIWRDGVIIDLNTLIPAGSGWTLLSARDVANDGRIVGEGFIAGNGRAFVLTPNCDGTYSVYGTACSAGAAIPTLTGSGCPSPEQPFALHVTGGSPGVPAMLLAGSGSSSTAVTPLCALQNLPLYPLALPLAFDSLGTAFLPAELPAGTPSFDAWLQALFAQPRAPFGVAGTQPIKLHFQ